MVERIQPDRPWSHRSHLRLPVDLGDAGRLAAQQLGREVAERADHRRLDQLELAVEVVLARLELVRIRVAVTRRPAVVDDPTGGHKVVGVFHVEAEEGRIRTLLVRDLLDFYLVEHYPLLTGF